MSDLEFTLPIEAPQIRELLPHRYPMLLVDRVLAIEPCKSVTAIKCVTHNEPFFQGHFPAAPIMPGVLMVEAIAQAGALMFLVDPAYRGRVPMLAGMNKVRFKRNVVPGDVLTMKIRFLRMKMGVGFATGSAWVGDELAVDGEIKFAFVDA